MFAAGEQTQFYIAEKLKQKEWSNVRFLYSGSNTPGEGEHKIMECIRGLQQRPMDTTCIYSPDADMIVLGLVTHMPNVIILRETAHRNDDIPPRGFACEKSSYDLIFLSILRSYFQLEFPALDIERVVDDFVLIVTFVGNDFVPTIPTFDINEGALSYLMDAYREAGSYLQSSGSINWTNLNAFFTNFTEHEKQVLEKRINDQKKSNKRRGTNHTKLFDISEQRTETEESEGGFAYIRERYYQDCFHIKVSDEESSAKVRQYVQSYLLGIQWVMHYYYRGCADWDWYYPQHYSPMLIDFRDLESLMALSPSGEIEFQSNPPYSHAEQILMVFPPAAEKLIPPEFRHLLNDPTLADIFPRVISIEHDILSAKATWSSVKVLIPFADRRKIQNATAGIALSEETQKLFATHSEKMYKLENGAITAMEIQPVKNPPFRLPERENTVVASDFPLLNIPSASCRVTSSPGSEYMDEYRLPTVRYVVPQMEESSDTDSLLGKLVFTGFPFRIPSLVEFISYKNRVAPRDQASRLSSDYRSYASRLRRDLATSLAQEYGIEVAPELNVIVHVRRALGYKKTLLGIREYEFDNRVSEVPLELCGQVPEGWSDSVLRGEEGMQGEFPLGEVVVLMDEDHFGSLATVTGYHPSDFYPKGNLEVATLSSPRTSLCAQLQSINSTAVVTYYRLESISQRLQIPIGLIARFTQSVVVADFSGAGERTKKYEIGLNLRKDKERLCVPGAVRWEYLWDQQTTEWEYSDAVSKSLEEYYRTFPEVWEAVGRQPPNLRSYYAKDIFGQNSAAEIRRLGLWLMRLPTNRRKWASIKSQEAPDDLIAKYLEAVDAQEELKAVGEKVILNPGLVYIPDSPATPRFSLRPQSFTLGDRVLLLKNDSHSAQFGAEGTVIATFNCTHLAVALDHPIRNSTQRHPVLTLPAKFVLNITQKVAGVNRGPKDYACTDYQTGSDFQPAFANVKKEQTAEVSRATIDIGAPAGDFKVVKGEDGLSIPLHIDYPHDLDKYEFESTDPLSLSQREIDVKLPEGFDCKILIDFVNK